MNKIALLACLIISISCAHDRGPASVESTAVAKDSIGYGSVKAEATKSQHNHEVCFDINLTAKNVAPEHTQASNWTIAWVDQKDQYHFLNHSNRTPASAPKGGTKVLPYGAYTSYSNQFSTCLPAAKAAHLKSLVLTPKELPFEKNEDLKFSWQ